jgi:hypothetical protein
MFVVPYPEKNSTQETASNGGDADQTKQIGKLASLLQNPDRS